MSRSNFDKKTNWKYYLLLVFIAIVTYWPLSFSVFTLKNDAIVYFLPFRYQISEAIQNGYFPFWSPYLYTGLPLHADIQSGVWNPVVLAISLFTKYNMSVLQWETLFYIIIGGIGFFKLCHFFQFEKNVCLINSVAYMCSGFIIDSGSFTPWITSAAYIPFVFLYFLRITAEPFILTTLKLAIALFLLFTAGYPSYFIFTAYIILGIAVWQLIHSIYTGDKSKAVMLLKLYAITGTMTFILSLPALLSYIDFFSYYSRGRGISLERAQFNPFDFKNIISFLFPDASYKLKVDNDISSRNSHIGLLPIVFLIYSLGQKWTQNQKAILLLVMLSFLFSLGNATPVRAFFYYSLPLMDSFRHPGTFRIFTIFGLLLLAGFGLDSFFKQTNTLLAKRIITTLFFLLSTGLLLNCIFYIDFKGLIKLLSTLSAKAIIDRLSFNDWVLINGTIQILFLIILLLKAKYKHSIVLLGIANSILFAWMAMPYTFISQHKSHEVNAFIKRFPKGINMSLLRKNVSDGIEDTSALTVYGYKKFYDKSISIQDNIITPTINDDYLTFLKDTTLRKLVAQHTFVFSRPENEITIKKFSPNRFVFTMSGNQYSELFVVQQFNHNWKVFVNHEPVVVNQVLKSFMKVNVPPGSSTITFRYCPLYIIISALIAVFLLLFTISIILYRKLNS